jgi:peptide/histidine transporter 3/4
MESGGGEIQPGPGLPVTSKPGSGRGGWRAALFIIGNHASLQLPNSSAGLHASLSLLLLLLPCSDGIL